MKPDERVGLRTLRARWGHAYAALRSLRANEGGHYANARLVSREWLLDVLETRVLELEHKIVVRVNVGEDLETPKPKGVCLGPCTRSGGQIRVKTLRK